MYQHKTRGGDPIALPVGKVVCIGQNYQDHIAEMKSQVAVEALFFMKPATALCDLSQPIAIPTQHGAVHNETELAVLLQQPLKNASVEQVQHSIWGYSLALDLTLRDVQQQLKQLGRPWEIAKGFDGACPMGPFLPQAECKHPQQLDFSLSVNGQLRQSGTTANMIRGIYQMISEMSHWFTLQPGDIVLTGTPGGVGPLLPGDELHLQLADKLNMTTKVIAA
ncbi:fumarylacetoacetate hydrolase family protein [Alkalimonas collagenimarina]|uniref:Fumarylacetoacetate hydrolase family protein n=1 Tax=Alkalimonas collagenimarina TaxID=400390 RepID=A0ABT9GUF0_9GAMM|nr:fumarylacetoacetate hydrolase family protein [Alkalimonas collagenimarina]MDP4534675.1 fumarylacetoacetate hydrolase family protein [Alkalimonas collagenimarina]